MTSWLKPEIVCLAVFAILSACAHGLTLDFPRLSLYGSPFLNRNSKRSDLCVGNPCEPSKPFLCRDSPKCVPLKYVCDETWDCDDGFDEDPAMCNAASRPSMEDLYEWVENEQRWMSPKFFNGADPEIVAHALSIASDMDDLRDQIGMTDDNVEYLRQAFDGVLEGDERPLLDMGMPERSWHEVKYVLQKLLDSGFKP